MPSEVLAPDFKTVASQMLTGISHLAGPEADSKRGGISHSVNRPLGPVETLDRMHLSTLSAAHMRARTRAAIWMQWSVVGRGKRGRADERSKTNRVFTDTVIRLDGRERALPRPTRCKFSVSVVTLLSRDVSYKMILLVMNSSHNQRTRLIRYVIQT